MAISPQQIKAVISIGFFDGVHLGHQFLISHLKKVAKEQQALSVLVTFDRHPSEILKTQAVTLLYPHVERLRLLKEQKVDHLLVLPFTTEFANQTAEEFLDFLYAKIPFSHLILGYDTAFGKNKTGTQKVVQAYVKKIGAQVTYLPPFLDKGTPVSSSLIRSLIKQGELKEASRLLGRLYSS